MRIVYLAPAVRDIAWFRYYYRAVFPNGDKNARNQLKQIQSLLAANPQMGRKSEDHTSVRELHIPRTPFSLVYRVTAEQIEILRLWDERQGRNE